MLTPRDKATAETPEPQCAVFLLTKPLITQIIATNYI